MFGRKPGKKKADRPDKKKPAKVAAKSRKPTVRLAGPVRKLPTNVYTIMLMISLLAMLTATVMMWIELARYGGIGAWRS